MAFAACSSGCLGSSPFGAPDVALSLEFLCALIAGFTIERKETFLRGGLRRRDISEGGMDHAPCLCVRDEFKESGKQLLLALVVDVGLVFCDLKLGLFVLHVNHQLDSIQVDT